LVFRAGFQPSKCWWFTECSTSALQLSA
jgi:hypothetical protein